MSYTDKKVIKSIIAFLCSDSGSHDYTISRTEARKMGLRVESPTQETYNELKSWFIDITDELELKNAYDPAKVIGPNQTANYLFKRCLIESVAYGQDALISEGILIKKTIPVNDTNQTTISNHLSYEGWRHF